MRKVISYILFCMSIVLIAGVIINAQAINTIKQQCQSPFQSDYGTVKITAAGDIYIVPCPTRNIFPSFLTSPLTTKGDIWGWNTTNARVPVGTNGQVLTANSANALGLSWQTPSGISGLTTGRLTFANSATSISSSDLIGTAGTFSPSTAGGFNVGTNALPFSGVFIGGAATNNIRLTGTASGGAKTATFPNFTGTVLETAGLTNNYVPRATSTAGVLTNTPFSWNGSTYTMQDATLNSTFSLTYSPAAGFGSSVFTVGNNFSNDQFTNFLCLTDDAGAPCGGNSSTTRIHLLSGNGMDMQFDAGNLTSTAGGRIVFKANNTSGSDGSPGLMINGLSSAKVIRIVGTLTPVNDLFTANLGSWGLGTNARPFTNLFIGNAATNNVEITSVATAARTITLPDATGTLQLQGAAGTISGLNLNAVSKAASPTTLTDSGITDNGAVIALTATDSFDFNTGIINIISDCAGVVTLDASGRFELSTTACWALVTGTPVILATGQTTTGVINAQSGGRIQSSVGGADVGNMVNYWIINAP